MRLDKFIFEYYKLKSRSYAEMLVKTGKVRVNGETVLKPAYEVDVRFVNVKICEDEGYASQGAYKLEEAFRVFPAVNVEGKTTADIGCSNGGFTDYMLRCGAKSVLAVDVADCSLDKRLVGDERVTFLKCNARYLPEDLEKVDFVCSDVSFISLKLIMGGIFGLLKEEGECVLLVKPQFELTRDSLSKKGIVLDIRDREKALASVVEKAKLTGFEILGVTESPIRYENKNIEYLLYMKKSKNFQPVSVAAETDGTTSAIERLDSAIDRIQTPPWF